MKKTTKSTAKKVAKKEYLNTDMPASIDMISAKFQLKQMVWKQGATAWQLILIIYGALSEAFINYTAKLVFDESPYDERIATLNDQISDIEADNRLFEDAKKSDIKDIEDEICEVKNNMALAKEMCPDIEFVATAVKVDWSGQRPTVTFLVDSVLVEKLNKVKNNTGEYKIELSPVK